MAKRGLINTLAKSQWARWDTSIYIYIYIYMGRVGNLVPRISQLLLELSDSARVRQSTQGTSLMVTHHASRRRGLLRPSPPLSVYEKEREREIEGVEGSLSIKE